MNLIPLNRICRPMNGDISTLPAWPSMHPFALGQNETLMVSSDNVRRFFYIFAVPSDWYRFLAFADQLQNYYLCTGFYQWVFATQFPWLMAQRVHRTIVGEAVQECVFVGKQDGSGGRAS